MTLSDEQKHQFIEAVTNLTAFREAAELKARQTGRMVEGTPEALAAVKEIAALWGHFYRFHQVGAVRFRGSIFTWNAKSGEMTIIPERGILTIEG
jgi:hypothetical protein